MVGCSTWPRQRPDHWHPLGFSVALWSATMLVLDLIDRRTMWRDYWLEWALAAVSAWNDDGCNGDRGQDGRAALLRPSSRRSSISICVFPAAPGSSSRHGPLEARAMKHVRITNAHQSMTFSRRMICRRRPGRGRRPAHRPHGLARDRREPEVSAAVRKQPRPADPRSAPARLDHRPQRQADRDQSQRASVSTSFPQQLDKAETIVGELAKLLALTPDDVDRIRRELKASRGFQPVQVAENVPTKNMRRSRSACPNCRESRPRAASRAIIRTARRSLTLSAMSDGQCQGI